MPSNLALPPVEYCRGTTSSHAAKSRPFRKAAPLPMAATMAVATIGPIPGICRMRVQPGSAAEIRSNSRLSPSILVFDCLPLPPKKIDQAPHLRCQVEVGVLKNVGQRSPQLRWSLRETKPRSSRNARTWLMTAVRREILDIPSRTWRTQRTP